MATFIRAKILARSNDVNVKELVSVATSITGLEDIVKFEISDRIRNCHLYGSPLEDNYKAHSIERNRPCGLEIYAIFS